jgi:hypothetical protein
MHKCSFTSSVPLFKFFIFCKKIWVIATHISAPFFSHPPERALALQLRC